MILTAHQIGYLPWLGLFHKIWLSDTFVSLDTTQYLTGEWMNRNKIKSHNGDEWLTVPVIRKGFLNKKAFEIRIDDSRNWRKKHFKTLCLNYKNSRYYDYYINILEKIYLKKWDFLSDLNEHILKIFLKELNIKVEFLKASDENFNGKGSDLVLDICKKLKADKFIFGSQGTNYVLESDFKENNIHARPGFPRMSEFPILEKRFNNPIAEIAEKRGISLPSAANITYDDIDFVCDIFKKIIKK